MINNPSKTLPSCYLATSWGTLLWGLHNSDKAYTNSVPQGVTLQSETTCHHMWEIYENIAKHDICCQHISCLVMVIFSICWYRLIHVDTNDDTFWYILVNSCHMFVPTDLQMDLRWWAPSDTWMHRRDDLPRAGSVHLWKWGLDITDILTGAKRREWMGMDGNGWEWGNYW